MIAPEAHRPMHLTAVRGKQPQRHDNGNSIPLRAARHAADLWHRGAAGWCRVRRKDVSVRDQLGEP